MLSFGKLDRSTGQVEMSKGNASPFKTLHDSTVGGSNMLQGRKVTASTLCFTVLQGSIWVLNKERGGFAHHYNNTANCYVIYCHIILAKGFSLSIGR